VTRAADVDPIYVIEPLEPSARGLRLYGFRCVSFGSFTTSFWWVSLRWHPSTRRHGVATTRRPRGDPGEVGRHVPAPGNGSVHAGRGSPREGPSSPTGGGSSEARVLASRFGQTGVSRKGDAQGSRVEAPGGTLGASRIQRARREVRAVVGEPESWNARAVGMSRGEGWNSRSPEGTVKPARVNARVRVVFRRSKADGATGSARTGERNDCPVVGRQASNLKVAGSTPAPCSKRKDATGPARKVPKARRLRTKRARPTSRGNGA
jgi:hypothetical protein